MIYRHREGQNYRNGLNWSYETIGSRWWIALVFQVWRVRVGFRYRSVFRPHFINYSGIRPLSGPR